MNDDDKLREQVSALADGQLQGDDFARAVEQVCGRNELYGTWRTYHVVGDVLRSGQHVACRDSESFVAGFRVRLAQERSAKSDTELPKVTAASERHRLEAANEPVFRWKLVAGVASLAAAAAIGWNWIGGAAQATGSAQQLAQGAVQVLPPSLPAGGAANNTVTATRVVIGERQAPQVMLRDARLDAILEAHQQAGGASHMPSGFLRNATFEGQSR